jgi:predicted Zn-dependent protease with MMP-like domain
MPPVQPYETLSESEWAEVDRLQELLAEGELEAARTSLDALLRRRPEHPDLRIEDATLKLEEGEPRQALAALEGAERSADPARYFYLRAAALHELSRFAEAEADALRSVAIHSGYAMAHDLLSRTRDHLGDDSGSVEEAEAAHALDPEDFPLPLEVSDEKFDAMVEKAVAELPEKVRERLRDVPILVQPLPSREMLADENPPLTPDLLGLFVGRHVFAQLPTAVPTAPGAIFLFRRNLLRSSTDLDELAREIRVTVQHEVGHLLGLDEDELEDWGLA